MAIGPPNFTDPTAWVVARRDAKAPADPWRPHGFFLERERSADGNLVESACVLLTGRECPWRCLMCDLWEHTLDVPTPPGAIPAQVTYAFSALGASPPQVKLYNSGSFFDPSAVPVTDYPDIAGRLRFARNVVVESHPRLVGEKVLRFRDLLPGGLEVAMGLETIHPEVLPRLNKRFTPEHFATAASFLTRHGVTVRTFLLVRPPYLGEEDSVEWALRSARFAFACGAGVVTLIPTRTGKGAMESLRKEGLFTPPTLRTIERVADLVLEACRAMGRVFVDLWNLDQFSGCRECFERRRQRLEALNFCQQPLSPGRCSTCGYTNGRESFPQ
jgi:radical SAM enzyme (TIGR01210 family)